MVQTLKVLLAELKQEELNGIWASAIHAWMRTLAFGHTAGSL